MPFWMYSVVTGLSLLGFLYAVVCVFKPFGVIRKRWQAVVAFLAVAILTGVANSIPPLRPPGIEPADWTRRTAICAELPDLLPQCLQQSLTNRPEEAVAALETRLAEYRQQREAVTHTPTTPTPSAQAPAAEHPPAAPASTVASTTPAPTAPASAPPPRVQSSWTYVDDVDEMRDSAIHHACTTSTNVLHFGFPYGSQRARLCIRQHPRFGQDVIVRLEEEGQFLCQSYQACTVRVRFDDGEVSSYSAIGPSDNSTNSVFIQNDDRFLRSLRSSSRVIVEAEFYQAGNQQMTFQTAGLEWPRR